MFIRNGLHVIAWDQESCADALFSRIALGEPILVCRMAGGGFSAMEDRCCHAPCVLSAGRNEGDCVSCGDHGLICNAAGQCVEVPGLDRVPPQAKVKTYPVALKSTWVFVWMGAPEKADAALLPYNFSFDHPDWKHKPGDLHCDTHDQLICDNLLHFSHLSDVHEKSLGGSTAIAQGRADIEPVPRGVGVTRRAIFDSLVGAFNEDRNMIGAQARNLALSPGVKMLPLAMDAALIQFLWLIDDELAAEGRH